MLIRHYRKMHRTERPSRRRKKYGQHLWVDTVVFMVACAVILVTVMGWL